MLRERIHNISFLLRATGLAGAVNQHLLVANDWKITDPPPPTVERPTYGADGSEIIGESVLGVKF